MLPTFVVVLILFSYQQRVAIVAQSSSETFTWNSSPTASSLEGWNPKNGYGFEKLKFVSDPDQSENMMMQVTYTGDTFGTPSGLGFTAQPLNITQAQTVTLSYEVKFPVGFQFVKGGKLPGLYGHLLGPGLTCGGGNRALDCFSARYMWRTNGTGELYAYVNVPSQNLNFCSAFPPLTVCNPEYGTSMGRGSFLFSPGKWTTLVQTIKLNTVGQSDGTLAIYVDGNLVISSQSMVWRLADFGFQGIHFETFFGGSDPTFTNPVSQSTFFKNFQLSYTRTSPVSILTMTKTTPCEMTYSEIIPSFSLTSKVAEFISTSSAAPLLSPIPSTDSDNVQIDVKSTYIADTHQISIPTSENPTLSKSNTPSQTKNYPTITVPNSVCPLPAGLVEVALMCAGLVLGFS